MSDDSDTETRSPPTVQKRESDRGRLVVHLLVVTFGVTSWSIMNGLWVELPILVSQLPEGWTLPADLTIVAQFGNLGPLVFSFLVYLAPNTKLEVPASGLIVCVLSLCALFYSFFWQETAHLAGEEYSIALLSLTFVQSVFAATTSQAYLALMAHLKARYMSSLFLGMGLSGLIPALVAVAQGSGDVRCTRQVNQTGPGEVTQSSDHLLPSVMELTLPDNSSKAIHGYSTEALNKTQNGVIIVHAESLEPALTVQYFFLFLFGLGLLSLLSLLLLLYHPSCREEHVDTDREENCRLMTSPSSMKDRTQDAELGSKKIVPPLDDKFENQLVSSKESHRSPEETEEEGETKTKQLGKFESWYLLLLLVWINAIQTSFLLAVQVYSSLPYGLKIYNGATKAENIVDPIACFITIFITAKTSKVISGLTLLGTLLATYIITMAALSPEPLLVDHIAGGILVISVWICCTMVMVYTKVSIAAVMRSQGRLSLIWSGASTQAGSFIGAVLAYVMVNHLGYFRDTPWCPGDQEVASG